MSLGFLYNGKVNIKLLNKDKKVKSSRQITNEGTSELFRFFMQCLVGRYQPANKPAFINLYTIPRASINDANLEEHNPEDYTLRLFRQRIPIVSAVVSNMSTDTNEKLGWAAKFSAPVAYYNIDTDTLNSDAQQSINKGMLVITSADNAVLARVYLSSDDMKNIRSIISGQQILIEWIMYITNKTKLEGDA